MWVLNLRQNILSAENFVNKRGVVQVHYYDHRAGRLIRPERGDYDLWENEISRLNCNDVCPVSMVLVLVNCTVCLLAFLTDVTAK